MLLIIITTLHLDYYYWCKRGSYLFTAVKSDSNRVLVTKFLGCCSCPSSHSLLLLLLLLLPLLAHTHKFLARKLTISRRKYAQKLSHNTEKNLATHFTNCTDFTDCKKIAKGEKESRERERESVCVCVCARARARSLLFLSSGA